MNPCLENICLLMGKYSITFPLLPQVVSNFANEKARRIIFGSVDSQASNSMYLVKMTGLVSKLVTSEPDELVILSLVTP